MEKSNPYLQMDMIVDEDVEIPGIKGEEKVIKALLIRLDFRILNVAKKQQEEDEDEKAIWEQ